MKDTLSLIIGASNDTLAIVVKNATNLTSDVKTNFLYSKEFWVAIFGLVGVIVGAIGTWYYKSKEINTKISEVKILQDNLLLQSKLFDETKTNNVNQMNTELVRLKDLSNQYELSLKKFDFDHLKELLELADDKNEKVAMLKEFASKLSDYKPNIPDWVESKEEYEQIIASHVFYRLEDIIKDINELLKNHATAFVSLHNNFQAVSNQAASLKRMITQDFNNFNDIDDNYIISKLLNNLLKLHDDYTNLINLLKDEFIELDKMKREFILNQSKKRSTE